MMKPKAKRIIIIGAGPAGLGSAYRLKELGAKNFAVYERHDRVGGLCTSFKDKKGFTWDLGGHVIFSHYGYYDKLLAEIFKNTLLEHQRNTWIRTMDTWIPYPFQNNIGYLPKNIFSECKKGLEKCKSEKSRPHNFKEWIIDNFGSGIAKYFMLPYNFKVWAYPLHLLSAEWVSERVSRLDSSDLETSSKLYNSNVNWGPNALFRYPLKNGVGSIFEGMSALLADKIKLKSEVVAIDPKSRKIYLANGKEDAYDFLINTSPLDKLLRSIQGADKRLLKYGERLKHNSVFIVGIGIRKPCLSTKSWMYFSDDDSPFFRVTYLSNYSPNNTPGNKTYCSLLCESSYSGYKKETKSGITGKTIEGLINSGMLARSDKKYIVSKFLYDIDYAYPLPTSDRDDSLRYIHTRLEDMNIYSRGRFGAWQYEIGNTDHSVMQGKEIADRIISGRKENVWKA